MSRNSRGYAYARNLFSPGGRSKAAEHRRAPKPGGISTHNYMLRVWSAALLRRFSMAEKVAEQSKASGVADE
jgi:hypothetical protein